MRDDACAFDFSDQLLKDAFIGHSELMTKPLMTNRVSTRRVLAEGLIIVISILVAFAIDAWWEGVQEKRQQAELIEALKLDFQTTKARLTASIERADSLVARTESFLLADTSDKDNPIESLRYYGAGAFFKINFEPALSAYESAVATGKIGLLDSPKLLHLLTEFNEERDSYELHDRITADIHYLGPVWDLRREFGSLSVLFDDPDADSNRVPLTDSQLRELYSRPLVTGAIEAVSTANNSIADSLRGMHEVADQILSELENL